MKKTLGALFMASVMVCSVAACFAGCGVKEGETNGGDYTTLADVELAKSGGFEMPEGGFDTSKPLTIKFYHTMGQNLRDQLDLELAEFEKLYPNIKVEAEQIGNYDDINSQVSTEINAGNQPNFAYCYPDHVAGYNRSNAVQALNDFLPGGTYADMEVTRADGTKEKLGMTQEQADMFIEGFWDEGHMFGDGTLMYTLPFAKSTEVLYYNKTFFDQNQLKVPTTWDEMEDVCKRILELDPDCIPLGYDSEANWFITMCEQYKSPYTSATAPRYLFNNDVNKAFVTRFADWYKKGYVTTQAIFTSYTSKLFTATTGSRCYMCIGSSAGAKNQKPPLVNDSDYLFEADIAQIPQVDPSRPRAISQGPSVCIFKKDDPQEVLASWLLIKHLTTSIEFEASFSSVSGYMAPLKMDIMKTNQAYSDFLAKANGYQYLEARAALKCLELADSYYTSPAFAGSSVARTQVGLLMQAAFGGKDINQAFKDAITACEYQS